MSSLFKKIKSVAKYGIDPILEGEKNYKANIKPIEEKAKKRSDVCRNCINFVEEPIDMFKITDSRILSNSDMMCDDCGCAITYLTRQDTKICKLWK